MEDSKGCQKDSSMRYSLGLEKEKILDRNRSTDIGPMFCKECGKFFEDKKRKQMCDYSSCRLHQGKEGFNLLDRL